MKVYLRSIYLGKLLQSKHTESYRYTGTYAKHIVSVVILIRYLTDIRVCTGKCNQGRVDTYLKPGYDVNLTPTFRHGMDRRLVQLNVICFLIPIAF